jgi:acyl-CoA dehydrogenase
MKMENLNIPPFTFPAECEGLRQEVRAFLAETIADRKPEERAENWSGFDRDFSLKLGARGWIGMVWPKKYGGHERTSVERYVVLEELLAAGAPVGSHWIADRQSVPTILKYGNEEQKLSIAPRVARGEVCFCIGMSEPDSGSDLAATRTKAEQTADGWLINGRKIWTTRAHNADYMIALFRTDFDPTAKHTGLSQFLIDIKNTPGITIRGIKDVRGEVEFNEVTFDNVKLAPDALLGKVGGGWAQVTGELALERSGPERYLSSVQLVVEMLDRADATDSHQVAELGRLVAEMSTLRQMSLGVAGMLSRGESPALLASIVKHQGSLVEQRTPELAHELFGPDLGDNGPSLNRVMSHLIQVQPSFSIRGGTREILRGMIARGLGLR